MSIRGVSDVVFSIDSSQSMTPCLEMVTRNISGFISGLKSNANMQWDLRLDFLTFKASRLESQGRLVFDFRTIHNNNTPSLHQALYGASEAKADAFFTDDSHLFSSELQTAEASRDEAPLNALDCCLDFPWRTASKSHRAIIHFTDEPLEQGVDNYYCGDKIGKLIDKFHKLNVILYIIAPKSPGYMRLSGVDKAEYLRQNVRAKGLAGIDMAGILADIGKTLSVTTLQMPANPVYARGIFGQKDWINGCYRLI